MAIRYAIVSGTTVSTVQSLEEYQLAWYAGSTYIINVEDKPWVQSGWLYDPVTEEFSRNWVQEQANALTFVSGQAATARAFVTISGIQYDTSDQAFGRLIARIKARELLLDGPLVERSWRLRNEDFIDMTLAQDEALLVDMYEYIQAVEDVHRVALAAVIAACTAQDLTALSAAKNQTWPT